jgi:hypothetical protein
MGETLLLTAAFQWATPDPTVMRASANWPNFKRNFARAFPGPEGMQLEMKEIIDV